MTEELLTPGIRYRPRFVTSATAQRWRVALEREIDWSQHRLKMFGREVREPRLSAWYGDPGTAYRYSGQRRDPLAWTPTLAHVRKTVSGAVDHPFNCVLCNLYRDGADAMGWHADDEPELGPQPVIASLSLGGVRRFRLRHRQGRDDSLALDLADGSLLIMSERSQEEWQHCLTRTRKSVAPRINLTFRAIYNGRLNVEESPPCRVF